MAHNESCWTSNHQHKSIMQIATPLKTNTIILRRHKTTLLDKFKDCITNSIKSSTCVNANYTDLGTRSASNTCNANAAAIISSYLKYKSFKPQFSRFLGARRTKASSSVTKIQTPCVTLYKEAHNFTHMQIVGEKPNHAKL